MLQIERNIHQISPRQVLEWIHLSRPEPRGTLFCPPLIGGSGLLAVRQLRQLARNGYNLISFNYAGHGQSSPPFSLYASLKGTRHMLDLTLGDNRKKRLPLFGVGLCYGGVPMLWAAQKARESLRGIILINALPKVFSLNLVRSFADFYGRTRSTVSTPDSFWILLRNYADRLFPNIDKSLSRFGTLERHRISLMRTLWEAIARNPLRSICLAHTPVLSIYSPNDPLLGAYRFFEASRNYEHDIRKICPRARFVVLRGDHFLSASHDRRIARNAIINFLEQPDPDLQTGLCG